MQDLLNEDDFIKKLPSYNPWKYLAVFYILSFILLIIICVILDSITDEDDTDLLVTLVMIILPTGSSFIMAFLKKQFVTVPLITIAFAILIMIGIYYIPIISFSFFSNEDSSGAFYCLLMYLINVALCSGIILPIINAKKKRLLKR